MKPRAIVLDIFGDYRPVHDGEIYLGALVELLASFAIPPSTTRVVMARMRKEGWFEAERVGRQTLYRMTEKTREVLDEGRIRIFERNLMSWDRRWRMVLYTVAESDRDLRDRMRRTLRWHGFGLLGPTTWVSPHPRLETVALALRSLGAAQVDLLTCETSGPEADLDFASRCWDLRALRERYDELDAKYREWAPLVSGWTGEEAWRKRIELINDYRSVPFVDPDLPAELLPTDWPGWRVHQLVLSMHDDLRRSATTYVHGVLARHR